MTAHRTEPRRLQGKTVLVTRPEGQSDDFRRLLEQEGAKVILCPTIEITPPESWEACDEAITRLEQYDGFVFTSPNAAKFFLGRAAERRKEATTIGNKPCYAVGAHTASAVSSFGYRALLLNGVITGKSLADALTKTPHRFVALPKGNLASGEAANALREHGIQVDEFVVYRTVNKAREHAQQLEAALNTEKVDLLTFFSPSSFENLVEVLPAGLLSGKTIAAIGSTTASAVRSAGFEVAIMPALPSSTEMANAIIAYYNENRT